MNTSIDTNVLNRVLDLAVTIQQIPAPPFGENQRTAYIRDLFNSEGLNDVDIDEVGNAWARFPGKADSQPLIISAHTDTVFPPGTPLQFKRDADRIYAPGIGDNSLGVAGLFGLLWCLFPIWGHVGLPGDLWLVANVGEEGLGNLRGMRAVVDRFHGRASAYLVLEGMGLGQIFHRGLGVQRYRISVHTPGGHSWVDHGRPSAINELANLITILSSFPLPLQPRTTLNAGTISGGTSVNTIAAEAYLELDLRSESAGTLETLVRKVEASVKQANLPDVKVSMEQIDHRPGGKIAASHPLVRLAWRCLRAQGIQPILAVGSTDANIPLHRKLPAVCVGLTHGGGAHTVNEFIEIPPLRQGLGQLVDLVTGAYVELVKPF